MLEHGGQPLTRDIKRFVGNDLMRLDRDTLVIELLGEEVLFWRVQDSEDRAGGLGLRGSRQTKR